MKPALLFSFDRSTCEQVVYELVTYLEQAEEKWRSTSPEWAEKMRAYNAWQALAKRREKQMERSAKQKPSEGDGSKEVASETSWEASFNPSEPSSDFSFAGIVSKEDVDTEIGRLARRNIVDHRALAALKRGIGIHHAGMNKRYRTLVERYTVIPDKKFLAHCFCSWFRQGYLRVVIATGIVFN